MLAFKLYAKVTFYCLSDYGITINFVSKLTIKGY